MRDPNDPGSWRWIGDIVHSIMNDIAKELGYGVNDVRHKVIEEGFHGRQTTGSAFDLPDRADAEHNRMAEQRDAVRGEQLTVEQEMEWRSKMPEQEKSSQREHEGIER